MRCVFDSLKYPQNTKMSRKPEQECEESETELSSSVQTPWLSRKKRGKQKKPDEQQNSCDCLPHCRGQGDKECSLFNNIRLASPENQTV